METVRKWIQGVWLLLLNGYLGFPVTHNIYQGPLKVICSPGLNCYSCPAATTYCPIGSLQQLLLGIRFAVENGQFYFGTFVMGSIGMLGASVGRFICGWACPFGLIQELLYKIPAPKHVIPKRLNVIKYGMLLFFVILLPLVLVDDFGLGKPWFCKYVCPAGTLEAGIPMLLLQPDLRSTIGFLFYNKLVILIGFIIWSTMASRPFCRTTCPLGAFYALFNKFSLIRLKLDEEKCTHCKACHKVCPMDVKFNEKPGDPECINCMNCMTQACQYGAISVDIMGYPLLNGLSAKHKKASVNTN